MLTRWKRHGDFDDAPAAFSSSVQHVDVEIQIERRIPERGQQVAMEQLRLGVDFVQSGSEKHAGQSLHTETNHSIL